MSELTPAERARWAAPALSAAAALGAMVLLRGFTVDDALIPARYAAHLARGEGYRWNVGGAVSDGVTPLPWVPLLAAVSLGASTLGALLAARLLGAASYLLGAALLGRAAARSGGTRLRFAGLLPLALSAPLAAWAVAGLETGLVTLLTAVASIALLEPRATLGAPAASGLAAAFRPELLPFALVASGRAALGLTGRRRIGAVLLAAGPFALVAGLRLWIFGRPYPLSVLAKPSDAGHGAAYVVAGLLLAGAPVLAAAPLAIARDASLAPARWLWAAALAGAGAVAMAGGDWMPLSRLLVPLLPPLMLAGVLVAGRAPLWRTLLRAALAAGGMLFAWARVGASARTVSGVRAGLLAPAREALGASRAVAALDVGWVGAATEASVVDLAGLTDEGIASLPGGHTSKPVTADMLSRRGVDALVLLRAAGCEGGCVRPDGGPYARAVEERVASMPWVQETFAATALVRSGPLTYVVWKQK